MNAPDVSPGLRMPPKSVNLHFRPMTEADAVAITSWRYPEPYSVYGGDPTDPDIVDYLTDPVNQIFAGIDESGDLVGFFSFGTDAQVPGELNPVERADPGILDVGLGMRPDLTGRGLGLAFVEAGLEFARATYTPNQFRMAVMSWNQRAIRVYERAGFRRVRSFHSGSGPNEREFVLLTREA